MDNSLKSVGSAMDAGLRSAPTGRLPNSNVAKEKAAIEQIVQSIASGLDDLHIALSEQAAKINPVLGVEPLETESITGFPYLGSSQLYEQLHATLCTINRAIERVNDITSRVEV